MRIIKAEGYEGPDRRSPNGGIWRWWMGAFFSILLVSGGSYASYLQAKITGYDTLVIQRGERIGNLETNYKIISSRLIKIEDKVDSINDKVTEMYREFNKKR